MPEKYIPVGSFDTIRISVEYGPTVFADLVISTNPEHGYIIRREHHLTPHYTKPHGRIVYTLSIGGSWHVDLSIMPPPQEIVDSQAQKIAEQAREIERMKDCMFHHMDSDTYNHCQEYLEKMRGKNENKTANEIDDV